MSLSEKKKSKKMAEETASNVSKIEKNENKMNNEKKQFNQTDEFETFETKDGRVVIPETAGEFVEGVFTGWGREIPHGKKDGEEQTIETVALIVVEKDALEKIIIPANKVLKDGVQELIDKGMKFDGTTFLRFTYLGKKESKNGGEYHNYKIQYRASKHEEIAKAGKYIPIGE